MNLLIASTNNTDQLTHDLFEIGHNIKQVDLSNIIDEPQLMQLESWADQIYCLTKEDQKILGFMNAFKQKIKLWKN